MNTKERVSHFGVDNLTSICPCGVEANIDTFIWASLGGDLVLLCWDCSAILHKKTIEEGKEFYG